MRKQIGDTVIEGGPVRGQRTSEHQVTIKPSHHEDGLMCVEVRNNPGPCQLRMLSLRMYLKYPPCRRYCDKYVAPCVPIAGPHSRRRAGRLDTGETHQ